jgi:hypothetical protein
MRLLAAGAGKTNRLRSRDVGVIHRHPERRLNKQQLVRGKIQQNNSAWVNGRSADERVPF